MLAAPEIAWKPLFYCFPFFLSGSHGWCRQGKTVLCSRMKLRGLKKASPNWRLSFYFPRHMFPCNTMPRATPA